MGLIFTIGSTISLIKTYRDLFEAKKSNSQLEESKV